MLFLQNIGRCGVAFNVWTLKNNNHPYFIARISSKILLRQPSNKAKVVQTLWEVIMYMYTSDCIYKYIHHSGF